VLLVPIMVLITLVPVMTIPIMGLVVIIIIPVLVPILVPVLVPVITVVPIRLVPVIAS
jgi:hypothetical protein